ncbi:hypothetical protein [Corallococcus llansteffanensis]|uniref:Uncharacterized protein n=1 Tax=Corallococcus llansteffanensis TaxID=2316731 RepID=A0A3A8P620_9BACT|nr:hypothetical protein [Corallococcus llansteffanensis]RKH48825.1 hypothetical protein D7V93_32725 [Corallococcus llansteffanensis]
MSRLTPPRRALRGAASVEMALSMIALIPIFMYALFLDDLLRYSLDAQEAAVTTVWDFTTQDYTKGLKPGGGGGTGPQGGASNVQHNARLTYCDHESGIDRPDVMSGSNYADCEDTDHHLAVVAHVCWMNSNAKQVTCEAPEQGAGELSGLAQDYQGEFTNGGLIKCSARAVVENYLLPEEFLPEFSDGVKLTKKNWKQEGVENVHDNAQAGVGGADGNAYFLKEQKMAILTDTWALTEDADISPSDSSGEMYDRVKFAYEGPNSYSMVSTEMDSFRDKLTEELMDDMMLMAFEDSPKEPYLSIHPHLSNMQTPANTINQEGDTRYFNQEWRDWDQDKNQNTYQHGERGDWYMGCKDAESC